MAITCARGVYVVENWLYKPGGDPAADWTGLSKQCRKDRILGAPIDSTVSGELVWRRSWSRLTGVQEVTRRFYCWGCFSAICDLPLDCPGCDGEARGSGFVFLYRGLPVARIGDHLFLEIRGRRSVLRTCPTSVMCQEPTGTWRGSGQCNPRIAGRSPA